VSSLFLAYGRFFNSNGIQGSNPERRSNYCKVLPSATQQISADMHPFFFASCDIYPSDGRLMLIAELPRAPILAMIFPNCIVEGIGLVSGIDKEG